MAEAKCNCPAMGWGKCLPRWLRFQRDWQCSRGVFPLACGQVFVRDMSMPPRPYDLMLITFNGGVREKIMKGRKGRKTGGHIENTSS